MLNTGPHSCIWGASNYLAPALATVSLFCDKLSHFSATVWTGFKWIIDDDVTFDVALCRCILVSRWLVMMRNCMITAGLSPSSSFLRASVFSSLSLMTSSSGDYHVTVSPVVFSHIGEKLCDEVDLGQDFDP